MNETNVENANNKLCLKTVYELLGEHFYIPSYQRGYRWTAIQVTELLDDIWEFSQSEGDKASFYCLQPIVVVKGNDCWEVVDGQQRLTTLYVLLHFLEKEHLRRDLKDAFKKSSFSIEYETRKESEDFLKNIKDQTDFNNIDFHHIGNAYKEVSRWFSERDYNDSNEFINLLLAKPEKAKSVQVIWYDLSDECQQEGYAIDVFSRINIGKIPLTNSELVKAMFLQNSDPQANNASLKQIQIATEWDLIEQHLQNPEFWYFIYNKDKNKKTYDTRIEFIFDLMKDKPMGAEKYYTFHEFNKAFKQSKEDNNGLIDIDYLWKQVKDYFLTFEQWYRDRELYHLIGFLVDCDYSIQTLKAKSEEKGTTKTAFKAFLKNEIRKNVNFQLDQLNYGDKSLRKVLLLLNIETLLATKEADIRFPFDRYKEEKWDIEHIRSQTDANITGNARKLWLKDVLDYYADTEITDDDAFESLAEDDQIILRQLHSLNGADKIQDEPFKVLYQLVAVKFKEEISAGWTDGIGNLALLDANTNRSYKNAMFPIKRKRIIHNDMNGIFVPICTKNVFMKFYSKKLVDVMYWKESDANEYLNAIKLILKEYLPDQEASYE